MSQNAQCLQVQIKYNIFDHYDPIFIIFFFSSLKSVCDIASVHGRAATCLLHFLMKKQAATALNQRIVLRSKSQGKHQKWVFFTTYSEIVSYLLEKYATDDVISETDAGIMKLTKPPNNTPIE